MQKYLILYVLLILPLFMNAQSGSGGERFAQIREARELFLEERLALSPEEREQFFPVFWSYETRLQQLRRQIGRERKNRMQPTTQLSESAARALLAKTQQQRAQLLALQAEAENAFLRVLSARKVLELQQAERDFRKKILNKLRQRSRG